MISFIKYALVCILILLAVYTDTRSYKIKNNILIIFTIFGFVVNVWQSGVVGIGYWATGLLIPIVILFCFFLC